MIEKSIQIVPGFTWFGKNIGLKDNALDFGGVLSDTVCNAAGVFTQNTMPGAPVIVGKEHLADELLQAIIVNSKYANMAIYGCDPNWGRLVMAVGKVFQYSEKVWGCDLTEEYVKINAHYTT